MITIAKNVSVKIRFVRSLNPDCNGKSLTTEYTDKTEKSPF